jgi:hypothetical protein
MISKWERNKSFFSININQGKMLKDIKNSIVPFSNPKTLLQELYPNIINVKASNYTTANPNKNKKIKN